MYIEILLFIDRSKSFELIYMYTEQESFYANIKLPFRYQLTNFLKRMF